MKLVVTGSRLWNLSSPVEGLLDEYASFEERVLIHGSAPGLDMLADGLARKRGWSILAYPANWRKHGKSAGHIRNQKMLAEHHEADLLAAFPTRTSRGTYDAAARAWVLGIPVRFCLRMVLSDEAFAGVKAYAIRHGTGGTLRGCHVDSDGFLRRMDT
jgi:hypothetical protein